MTTYKVKASEFLTKIEKNSRTQRGICRQKPNCEIKAQLRTPFQANCASLKKKKHIIENATQKSAQKPGF